MKPRPPIANGDRLGNVLALSAYMPVSETWLFAVERRARHLTLTSPWVGNKATANRVMTFLSDPLLTQPRRKLILS
jgi:hypothetical protein